jgi:ATP-binding cassette subfamily F protein 3
MAGQNTRQAQSRLKAIERMERIDAPAAAASTPGLKLAGGRRSGDIVVRLRDLSVGYDPDSPLLTCDDVELRWRGRAALIGPNGSGKTTLLRTLRGVIPPLSGQARLGSGVRVGYLSQSHDRVRPGATVLEHILDHGGLNVPQARAYLGRYRFSGDDAYKDASTLSGGERARLALAMLELDGANLLLLDEPTNHLDIASQEVLQAALSSFDGTVLIVTHDRFLIRALGGQVWAIEGGRLLQFEEGYDQYRSWRDSNAGGESGSDRAARRSRYESQKRGVRQAESAARRASERRSLAEKAIGDLERRVAKLEGDLADASARKDVEAVVRLADEHAGATAELDAWLAEWLALEFEESVEAENPMDAAP